jgi:uncharacterized protein (TIGR00251 family)
VGYTGGRSRPPDAPARVGLRVSPGAARSEVVGRHGKVWKVRIAARAERGRANDALVEFLAETLGVPRRSVVLVAGAGGRDKVVEVAGMTNDEADRLLAGRQRGGSP